MKTLSKGRETPINDIVHLRYTIEPENYERQSKEFILSTHTYVELKDGIFLLKDFEKEMNKILFFSNYPDYAALITGEVFKFYRNELTKLSLFERIKWHYELDIKGVFRRLWHKPQYALNHSSSQNNQFKNGRFDTRTANQKQDFNRSSEVWTNEENWLIYDALRLAQLTCTNEEQRPSCISELISQIITEEATYIDSYYMTKIAQQNLSAPNSFNEIYYLPFVYSLISKDFMIDYKPFLKKYKKVLDISTSVKHMNHYYTDYKQYLHLNKADRFQRNVLNIPRRIWELII